MMRSWFSRRRFLQSLAATGGVIASPSLASPQAKIDRRVLVERHSPVLKSIDRLSPLSLGNGAFAFTADVTGLQTFPKEYLEGMPLCTMSEWGWHTVPAAPAIAGATLRLTEFETFGRKVGYAVSSEGQAELFNWLRENPHRLHLGRLAFCERSGADLQQSEVKSIEQRLDLWTGTITSRFELRGSQVTVRTTVHPREDLLAIEVESALLAEGDLAVKVMFPYGSPSMDAANWNAADRHSSTITTERSSRVDIARRLDDDRYFVAAQWETPCAFESLGRHEFRLSSKGASRLKAVLGFSRKPRGASLPGVAQTFSSSRMHWQQFWTTGGAIELAGSKDSRATELERRIVLSQYLTAIQCSGSAPPQETGLTVNSWYGKFHLEMHWWHAAHFALWNRLPLLERSLGWYSTILPSAREHAMSQGYRGARWPKMVGPEGRDSPSPIGPLLIWQQPHPIFYAELCYLAHPNRATLERYSAIVFESAEFMASFAYRDATRNRYVLGPPLIPAQENHPPGETWNPTFELEYWRWGLDAAQRWRERLGLKRKPEWTRVAAGLSPLPVSDGVYLAHENCPQTFTERNRDHPSMLAALGVLPGRGVDRETMRRTLIRAMREWKWDETWGWDYGMTAMTAARLGERQIALDALLMPTAKNRYLTNGHNWQRQNLPCYLPGNGGLLYATAMMAAGWAGGPKENTPGFPSDGSWSVRWENLSPASV
jgi:protein-glucosylgalactosylhydroxylysine glucosidase